MGGEQVAEPSRKHWRPLRRRSRSQWNSPPKALAWAKANHLLYPRAKAKGNAKARGKGNSLSPAKMAAMAELWPKTTAQEVEAEMESSTALHSCFHSQIASLSAFTLRWARHKLCNLCQCTRRLHHNLCTSSMWNRAHCAQPHQFRGLSFGYWLCIRQSSD